MGGGNYSYDVAREARSSNNDAFSYAGYATGGDQTRREVHPILNPYGAIRECVNPTPVVVALDVTRSRGDDSRIVYEKLPTLIGQIEMKGYVEGAAISFAAIGDATDGDQAPLQVSQFEADNRLDEALSKFWLEEGGGGTGQESYELAAFYYARRTELDCLNRGKKGYLFFIGDEGFYPTVKKSQVRQILGIDVEEDIDSEKIFRELQERFSVYFIFPNKSAEDRRADIDAEIKQRVESAGGQYKNVDIRASLIWNNRNDLDLHIVPPSGEEVYYGHKRSACGGWLDVDMNVQGETLKPVENIRWSQNEAPEGRYKVFVRNYAFHEQDKAPTFFKVEIEIAGEIQHFEGTISPNRETGPDSDQLMMEFHYDPRSARENRTLDPEEEDPYAAYDDEVIKNQWASIIPKEHILSIDDSHTIIDVMLGVLSLENNRDLDDYIVDLKGRDDGPVQLEQTRLALTGLAQTRALSKVSVQGGLPSKTGGKIRKGGKRL